MPKLTKRLTDTVATRCAPPRAGYQIYWCAKTPGFGVLVMANGKRSWVFERRDLNGKTKRRSLGRVSGSGRSAISAEVARVRALAFSNDIAQGKDPVADEREAEKQEQRVGLTFAEALEQYVKDDSARKHPLKDRTRADYRGMIRPASAGEDGRVRTEGELAPLARRRLDALTGSAIKSRYQVLQKRGPTRAAYAMRVLRGVLNYHGVKLDENPFDRATPGRDRIKLPTANKRDRVIPAEKLHAWWKAASAVPKGDYFKLTLLTGLRPQDELAAVKISDVDTAGWRISIGDPKSQDRKAHVVLLSEQAREIVTRNLTKRVGKKEVEKAPDDFLIDQVVDPRKSLNAIIKQSGVAFSPYDLRRTFGTIAGGLLPGYVVKRLMGHADGNDITAGHYVHLDEATLRAGWQTVADYISTQASQRPTKGSGQKVVPIRRKAAA